MRSVLLVTLSLVAGSAPPAAAGLGDADSVYLVGEFVDPICAWQHGMQGAEQRICALVPGRVDQGIYFLDVRERTIYPVIGRSHWEDPQGRFAEHLGDTVAVVAKVWERYGSEAIAITRLWPWRAQPEPAFAWWPWSWEWSVLAGCGLLAVLYLLALGPLRARLGGPPGFEPWRAFAFCSSLAVVVVSLNGPLHDLSDAYLFSTHMVQHLLLAEAFPPLLLVGVPPWLWRWLLATAGLGAAWRALTRLPRGFVLYTIVFCIWHVPLLYNLMMRNHDFHVAMHLMVMGTAVLLWWPILGQPESERPSPPARMLYLFAIGIPMSAVAAFITFAEVPLYEWYALAPRLWGFGAVEDQRLGGLIMWVPGAWLYWGMLTAVFFRWALREEEAERAGRTVTQRAGA